MACARDERLVRLNWLRIPVEMGESFDFAIY